MTAVVEGQRRVNWLGDMKVICIQSDAACATGHTIDFNSDVADGRARVFKRIHNTLLQDDAGADVAGTFDPATGIYTVGTVTTGIHNLTVIGE